MMLRMAFSPFAHPLAGVVTARGDAARGVQVGADGGRAAPPEPRVRSDGRAVVDLEPGIGGELLARVRGVLDVVRLGEGEAPAAEGPGQLGDVGLVVAIVRAQAVELHHLAGVVLVGDVGAGGVVEHGVQPEGHGRILADEHEEVVELRQPLAPEQLQLLEHQGGVVDLVPAGGEEVVPEERQALLEGVGVVLHPPGQQRLRCVEAVPPGVGALHQERVGRGHRRHVHAAGHGRVGADQGLQDHVRGRQRRVEGRGIVGGAGAVDPGVDGRARRQGLEDRRVRGREAEARPPGEVLRIGKGPAGDGGQGGHG